MLDSQEPRPLKDVTVIDLTQVIAGPFASMMLGDLGAEVIKVERTGTGDLSREWEPSPFYHDTLNRNKRSVSVDLKTEEGREVVRTLLRDSDVFIENMKPGRTEKFGLAYEDVTEVNDDIVYCSIKGYGADSPYQGMPAWDIVIQAMSGVMGITGEEDGDPVWSGVPVGDLASAQYAVNGILSALYSQRAKGSKGEFIEVPMLDATISLLTARAGHTFGTGESFPRNGTRHPTNAPFGVFETGNGRIVIGAGTAGLWPSFCDAIDRPELATDPRFDTKEDRLSNRTELVTEIESTLGAKSDDEWLEIFRENDIPAGPIHDSKSVWDDDHVVDRGLKVELEREDGHDAESIANPLRFGRHGKCADAPPILGEDTTDVLTEAGFSEERIEELRSRGVVE